MSAISLYPMETVKVINNVYVGDPGPAGQPSDPINEEKQDHVIVKVIQPLPFATDGLNQIDLDKLFVTMTTLLNDIKSNIIYNANNEMISVNMQTINKALDSIIILRESIVPVSEITTQTTNTIVNI